MLLPHPCSHDLAFIYKEISHCLLVLGLDDGGKGGEGGHDATLEAARCPSIELPRIELPRRSKTLGANPDYRLQLPGALRAHYCHCLSSHYMLHGPSTLLVAMKFLSDNLLLVELERYFLFSQPSCS